MTIALGLLIGCDPAGTGDPQVRSDQGAADVPRGPEPTEASPQSQPPQSQEDNGDHAGLSESSDLPPRGRRDVMAIVNGEVLYLKPLTDALITENGYKLAQQMIADRLVRQKAQEMGIQVTPEEIEEERDIQLAKMMPQIQDPAQRRQMQPQLIQNLGVTRQVWEMVLHRNALLGKIAAKDLEISEEMLRKEFARQYQQKVRVRHMQLPSLPAAQHMLQRLERGEEFAALVRQNSMGPTASAGGLLEPFGARDDTVPEQLRKSAMRLTQPGDISEVIVIGKSFHLLKLEEIIPPADVKFEDVRNKLRRDVRSRIVDTQKPLILNQLFRQAVQEGKILFVHPILKQQHEAARQRSGTSDRTRNRP
jgi:parvulin-like peptidyl-prolyl isomerase